MMKNNCLSKYKAFKMCPWAPPAGSVFYMISDAAKGHMCPTLQANSSHSPISLVVGGFRAIL